MPNGDNGVYSQFWNGRVSRVITTAMGILLAGLVATGFHVNQQVHEVSVKQDTILDRMDRIENRLESLERSGRGPNDW